MSADAMGATRLTILAGTTSTGAGGFAGAGGATLGMGTAAEPELDGVVAKLPVVTGGGAAGVEAIAGDAPPAGKSLASRVRPGKVSLRLTVVTGAELMGALSGIDCCVDSPMGAPKERLGGAAFAERGGSLRCG